MRQHTGRHYYVAPVSLKVGRVNLCTAEQIPHDLGHILVNKINDIYAIIMDDITRTFELSEPAAYFLATKIIEITVGDSDRHIKIRLKPTGIKIMYIIGDNDQIYGINTAKVVQVSNIAYENYTLDQIVTAYEGWKE